MKILIFSDIHGDVCALANITEQSADIYIAAGDLATFSRGLERCGEVLKPLGQRLWVLPGNHETHLATKAFCQHFGFIDFHRQRQIVESRNGPVTLAGLGYSNITPFGTPGEYTEDEFSSALAPFDGIKPLYLVAHCPPYGTRLDEYSPGKHAGSPALRTWIEREQPVLAFCGHIHETAGLSEFLGATECINVGKYGYTLEL